MKTSIKLFTTMSILSYKDRESQIELLRIVSIWIIVFYHMFMDYSLPLQEEYPIYKGIQIPLHIGVLLFVLISGYFGIKASLKGFLRVLSIIVVYWLPLALFVDVSTDQGVLHIIKDFMVVSYPRYWFFRCYIFLYLFSPVINTYLNGISIKNRLYILLVLVFIAVWVGTSEGDTTLSGGKNLTNFLLLYVLGDTLQHYKTKWYKISSTMLLLLLIIINIVFVTSYVWFSDGIIGKVIFQVSFPYCSPILLLNAIIVFMLFAKINIRSKVINYIATSVFSVYLIHYHRDVWPLLGGGVEWIYDKVGINPSIVLPCFAIYSILICVCCILIDKTLSPLWNSLNKIFIKIESRVNSYITDKYGV